MTWFHNISNARFPVIQAPMYGVATLEMASAAARAGCLGSVPAGDMDYDETAKLIRRTREILPQTFALNIFANEVPKITPELEMQFTKVREKLLGLATSLNFEIEIPQLREIVIPPYQERIRAAADEGVKILSFTFGAISGTETEMLRSQGITSIGTACSEKEALFLAENGTDAICVQGFEAGGHRGFFLEPQLEISGFPLLQNIAQQIKIPLVYAGGIRNKTLLRTALDLGAEAVQVGTALLCSRESALSCAEKRRLQDINENEIGLTKSFSGREARGLINDFAKAFSDPETVLPYPYQNKITAAFRKAARNAGNTGWQSLWCGQAYKNLATESAETILKDLVL